MAPAAYQCKHGKVFDPAKDSCAQCDAEPSADEDERPGEGEMLCAEAKRRGLPDGFDVEERIVAEWLTACERSEKCATRSDQLADASDMESAIRWEMAAAKWADTSIKAAKIVAGTVQTRERVAAADRADRAQEKAERQH